MNWRNLLTMRKRHQAAWAVLCASQGFLCALRLEPDDPKPRMALFALREVPAIGPEHIKQMAIEHGLHKARLICLLSPEDYQTVLIDAPHVAADELNAALRWRVKDLIDFHIDDAVLEHLTLPAIEGRVPQIWVCAAKSQAVRRLAEHYLRAGLQLEVIDVQETAQRNLAALIAPEDYAVAMLHVDGANGLLTFSLSGELLLSRRIEGRGDIGEQLRDRIALETQRSVDYFERQFHTLPLAKLYLAPMAEQAIWREWLSTQLTLPVEGVGLERFIDLTGHERLQEAHLQNQVFHLAGAALRGVTA